MRTLLFALLSALGLSAQTVTIGGTVLPLEIAYKVGQEDTYACVKPVRSGNEQSYAS